jgi:glycosyltransferase involved in cell wall biosynthesis
MIVENHSYPYDTRVRLLSQSLKAAGFNISVICPRENEQKKFEVVDGINVYRYPSTRSGSGLVGFVWEFSYSTLMIFLYSIFIFFREGFDIIHSNNPPDTIVFIGIFYKVLGKKVVYDEHDLSPELYESRFGKRGGMVYKILCFLEKLSARSADLVITVNESYQKIQIARTGIDPRKSVVIRNGPSPSRVYRVEPDEAIKNLNKTILYYVGVIGPQDGLDNLVYTVEILVNRLNHKSILCIVSGDGESLQSIKELVLKLNLEAYFLFTGRVYEVDLRRYLSTADICLDSSPFNPLNDISSMVKIMEYMAVGKPVVCFDLTENRYIAKGAALFAPSGDNQAFAQCIIKLINNHTLANELGAEGLKRINTELSWSFSAEKLVKAYYQLTGIVKIPQQKSVEFF